MSFTWRYHDETGADVPGPTEEFADKRAAENWFAGQWLQLRQLGAKTATLVEDGSAVSEPMPVEEA
jgi:hypothetical protein